MLFALALCWQVVQAQDVAEQGILLDGVAAHVNESVITIGEVIGMMEPVSMRLHREFQGQALAEKLEAAYGETLERMIGLQLILEEYRESGAQLPEWAVDNRIDRMIADTYGGEAALLDSLVEQRQTYSEWRDRMKEQIIIMTMRQSVIDRNTSVSPAEVRAYYEAHPAEFRKPARIRLRMILVQKSAAENETNVVARAQRVVERLAAGEPFEDVARALSDGSKADEGGDWGWIEPGLLRGELAEVALSLDAGETSALLSISGVYYILRLEEKTEAGQVPFETVQSDIESRLRRNASETQYAAWIERLRAKAYVKIFDVTSAFAL